MPFKLNSPNAIAPAHTLTAFFFSVMFGASRFAHSDWLRADKALHAVLGIPRFPGTDTIRNFPSRFSQGAVESFWSPPFGACPTSPHLRRASTSNRMSVRMHEGSLEPALSSQSPAAAQWCAPQRGLKRGRFSAQDLVDYIALDAGQAPLHPVVFEGQFFMV
jgi:hypothetical protein